MSPILNRAEDIDEMYEAGENPENLELGYPEDENNRPGWHCPEVFDYLTKAVNETVRLGLGDTQNHLFHSLDFDAFVLRILSAANINMATVITVLVYLARAQPHLHISQGVWAHEHVFLGALIIANKYANDVTYRNRDWARCTGVLGVTDVGLLEREFLVVLDWELGVSQADLDLIPAEFLSLF
ncbi:hypothetical protein C8R43DRAFT_1121789 [Mycena crocata]|nr:hypothetical protein C8R43DRAFT_1121789 [Mycena crocata]